MNNPNLAARWVTLGGLVALLSVLLGAFGAHGLKAVFNAQQMSWYNTAFEYQIIHALALIITGLLAAVSPSGKWLTAAGWFFLIGIVLFSGSLYVLSLTGLRWLGAITPFGGTAFLAGWALLAIAGLRLSREHSDA